MNKPRPITIYTRGVDASKNTSGMVGERVYASREAISLPFGASAPAPDSWEPVAEARGEVRGGRFCLPDFELEPTAAAPGRVKFYAVVPFDAAGRELQGKDGNTFVLPHQLGPRANFLDVFGFTLQRWPHLNPKS